MKKIMTKVLSIVMAAAMCVGLAGTALAASDYTITVENSIGGTTYSAYKVFDATYNDDAVSYTIDSGSAWYEAVSGSDLFTLNQSGSSTTYYVELASSATETAVISFLNTTYTNISSSLTASASEDGTGSAIELDVNEPGYYYVTTSQGAIASVTTAAPSATVVDKNQKPGEGGKDPLDESWGGGFSKDADDTSYSIGDKVKYTIKSYVPTYDGDKLVGTYTITDTMGEGLTYDNDMIVYLSGTGLSEYEDITSFCTISVDANNVLTVTWNPATIEAASDYTYPADAVITIYYTDTVNEVADDADLTNSVSMQWTRLDPTTGEPDPEDPDDGTTGDDNKPEVQVYTYGFDLKKTDGTNTLEGAQFTLAKAGTEITFLYDADTDTYEEWDGSASGITTNTITVGDGEVNIWGLGAGTYTLTETVAPNGYNLLAEPVTITIATTDTGWTVTVNGTTTTTGTFDSTDDHGVDTMPTVTIVNEAGSAMPSTGGFGTTMLYVAAGIVVVGAVTALVLRRRSENTEV